MACEQSGLLTQNFNHIEGTYQTRYFLANLTCSYVNNSACVSVWVLPLLLGQPVVHSQQLCVVSLGRQLVHNSILGLRRLSGTLQGIQHACPIREGEKD